MDESVLSQKYSERCIRIQYLACLGHFGGEQRFGIFNVAFPRQNRFELGAKTRCVWVSVKYIQFPMGCHTLHANNNNIPHTDSRTCRKLSVNSLH